MRRWEFLSGRLNQNFVSGSTFTIHFADRLRALEMVVQSSAYAWDGGRGGGTGGDGADGIATLRRTRDELFNGDGCAKKVCMSKVRIVKQHTHGRKGGAGPLLDGRCHLVYTQRVREHHPVRWHCMAAVGTASSSACCMRMRGCRHGVLIAHGGLGLGMPCLSFTCVRQTLLEECVSCIPPASLSSAYYKKSV